MGGILGSFEDDFEKETSVGGVFEAIVNEKFPSKGSIEFNAKQAETEQSRKQETDRKKAFYQAIKEDLYRAQKSKDKLLEEEIGDILKDLSTKNRLLLYQAGYKDRSIYQRAELRKKLIEEQKKSEKEKKAASIPSPAKQPSALEGAFEGRSGTQGGGTANLSAQAVG